MLHELCIAHDNPFVYILVKYMYCTVVIRAKYILQLAIAIGLYCMDCSEMQMHNNVFGSS